MNKFFYLLALLPPSIGLRSQVSYSNPGGLHALQQQFIDLRFGMFIHFNIPTFANADWPDPDLPASVFNPTKLDCNQWARAARSAHMSYGCLTTKHHSGFCIWDTKTTDYNVMHSPFKKDVVREYVNAFRAQGLKVFLYYSILDTHHKLRPGFITRQHIEMIKAQLTELLTNYGEITALIIDGWDAPWSRISYDDVPFEEIYTLVKSLQPNHRPIICTEYMARGNGSTFDGTLPVAKRLNVGAINWGFVAGKTQTYLPWDSWQKPYVLSQPTIWFHEVFKQDWTPYRQHEVDLIRTLTGRGTPPK